MGLQRRAVFATFGMTAVLLALAGCAPAGLPYPPVPAPLSEIVTRPPLPSYNLIWRPGHWTWTGSTYNWEPGEWVDRGGHGNLWQDGYWTLSNGSYAWVPGHFM